MRGTTKTPVKVKKNPVRKSIAIVRDQKKKGDFSHEDYRPDNDVLCPHASQTDSYDSGWEENL